MAKKEENLQAYKAGDIFAFELVPGEYAFGRLILDLDRQCYKTGKAEKHGVLGVADRDAVFFELFQQTSPDKVFNTNEMDVLIPGMYAGNYSLEDFEWEVVAHVPIDPEKVDFPEFLTIEGAFSGKFIKGELSHVIEIPMEEVERIGIYPSMKALIAIPEYVLYALGRIEEIREDRRSIRDMKDEDIRYSEHRKRVYDLLPAEYNQDKSYYELAKEKGFDLQRFYE